MQLVIDESLDDLSLVKAVQAGSPDAENALLMRYKKSTIDLQHVFYSGW